MSAILERTLAPAEKRVVVEFAARLRTRFAGRLARVVLFGSRARGDVTEESDIDVLVLLRIPIAEETRATREVWGAPGTDRARRGAIPGSQAPGTELRARHRGRGHPAVTLR